MPCFQQSHHSQDPWHQPVSVNEETAEGVDKMLHEFLNDLKVLNGLAINDDDHEQTCQDNK